MSFDLFIHKLFRRPYLLHTEIHGKSDKPVLVMLHGIAASGEDWSKFTSLLKDEYNCITIDLLGFGKSPKPDWPEYSMHDHMRSLYHTMNKLGIDGKFTLIGHSLGSLLAARYATEHEQNLNRLLLLSPPVYPPLASIERRSARKLTGLLLTIYRFLRSNRMTPDTFRRLSYIAPLPKAVVRDPSIWVPFMRTLQRCIEEQTILHDVSVLHVPTEVFYGTLDQVVVSNNVELLGTNKQVTLHTFVGTHDLTARYARTVKKFLTATN